MIGAQKGQLIVDVACFVVEDRTGRFGLPLSDASIPTCAIGPVRLGGKNGRAGEPEMGLKQSD
jgi:hypothetical protein